MLFRVCYGDTSTYKILGNQVNFKFGDFLNKKKYLLNIHNVLLPKLRISMQNYKYTGENIFNIQLLIYKLEYTNKLIKSINTRFSLKKLGVTNKLITTNINNLNLGYNNTLPLSMDLDIYKNKLKLKYNNGFITFVFINGK